METIQSKTEKILSGLRFYIFRNKDVERLAKYRASICGVCEHSDEGTKIKCKLCGCILVLKIRSMTNDNKCLAGKW